MKKGLFHLMNTKKWFLERILKIDKIDIHEVIKNIREVVEEKYKILDDFDIKDVDNIKDDNTLKKGEVK